MIASIITALYLWDIIPAQSAYTFLYICGFLLIIGEVLVTSYGLIALNAIFAFAVGYAIQNGTDALVGFPVDWSLLFGLAATEAIILGIVTSIMIRYRKLKPNAGKETMVGQKARIVTWAGASGTAIIEGENWKISSDTAMELKKDDMVTVSSVDGLTLKISR